MNFSFKENYILENESVQLRPLELSDFNLLSYYSINESDIWNFNAGGANGTENLKKYISNAIKQRENEREYTFIVFDKISGNFVGSTRFYSIFSDLKTIEIGYTWYGKKYQGTGINKSCKFLLLEFAFEKLQMERVAFAVNAKNERSLNAMKNIGCVTEGTLRSCHKDANEERIDVVRLSILKDEWNESVKMNLKNQIAHFASR